MAVVYLPHAVKPKVACSSVLRMYPRDVPCIPLMSVVVEDVSCYCAE